jgi:hypothetical protein
VADLPAIRARLAVLTEGYVPASLYREDVGALLAEVERLGKLAHAVNMAWLSGPHETADDRLNQLESDIKRALDRFDPTGNGDALAAAQGGDRG